MGHSHYDPAACRAWNAGKKVGTKRPLNPRQIWRSGSSSIESGLRDRVARLLVLGAEIRARAMVMQH